MRNHLEVKGSCSLLHMQVPFGAGSNSYMFKQAIGVQERRRGGTETGVMQLSKYINTRDLQHAPELELLRPRPLPKLLRLDEPLL
jgi:hypothetical protein